MSISNHKRLTVLLSVVLVASLGLVLYFCGKLKMEQAQQRELWNTIYSFDKLRDIAIHSEPKQAVSVLYSLDSAVSTNSSYYAKIYEHERQSDIREIIVYLRQKTGEDFGNDPKKWIERFDK